MAKKILGLDLGTNSIGWALVEVDSERNPLRILGMGSRIIPLTSDERDQFQQGKDISKNKERTNARTQRKGYDRKQLKKSNLKKMLSKLDIFPSEDLLNLNMLMLWRLRSAAATIDNEITPRQLGRILYMLSQKRGYKSSRSEENSENKKDTEYVAAVKGRYAKLKETNKTLGQFFYDHLKEASEKSTYYKVKEEVYPRVAYEEEFDTIMRVQKGKHKFLTDEVIHQLRNEILFYQRPLKSQKGLVSKCDLTKFEVTYKDKETGKEIKTYGGPKVAPKSSPLFQMCKIWEIVNNISFKVKNEEGAKYKWSDRVLSVEEKKEIADYLMQNEKLTSLELLKRLGLKKEEVYLNKQLEKGLQGNITYTALYKITGENEWLKFNTSVISSDLVDKETGEIIAERLELSSDLEKEPLYQLWHTIYSIKDLEECKNALIKRFSFSEEQATKLAKIDFTKQSFGDKSNKAMRRILPYLMKGYFYSEASEIAGYKNPGTITNDENEKRELLERIELLKKNSLRQPVVEKILNQMINVVNAIIDKYGKPDEVRIELARELKQSKEERNDSESQNEANKKLHEEITGRLASMGLPATKKLIQKYKFIFPVRDKKIKEAKVLNQCIYCGRSFDLSEALTGDGFDVDHIVPQSLLFDDSQTNKVLVHRSCNADKNNKTAYDYIASKGQTELNAYVDRIDTWFKANIISYSKMQRLKASHEEYLERKKQKKETEADKKLWESFIDRQLRETQYITRKSKEILRTVCRNVHVTEGTVTAKLRNLWGWDDVLMNLQLPKYKELGQTEVKEWTSDKGNRVHKREKIVNWSKRDDHRHHAIDALVIACTQQGFIQRINTLNASETRDQMLTEVKSQSKKPKANVSEAKKEAYNERLSLLDSYLISKKPFNTIEVEQEAAKILVSFKSGKKAATNGVRKTGNTGKKKIVQEGIIIPRGALHEQFVYGKIKVIENDKPLRYLFDNSNTIANEEIKQLIEKRIEEFDNDAKSAFKSVTKSPILYKGKPLEKADCFKEEYVIKYKLPEIKVKDVPFIVDEKIRELVRNRLEQHNGKEKEAFKEVLWFNEKKQIPIKTVRCFTGLSAVEPVKKNEKGEDIGFAKTGNNHHVAIYKDEKGNILQHLCTFWHAVERKKYGIPYIIEDTKVVWEDILNKELSQSFMSKLPNDNMTLKLSMQQNEMFILGLDKDQYNLAIKENNKELLSKHLYLVWSLSDNNYWFRHHLETKNSELKNIANAKESNRYYNVRSIGALEKLNPIKIRINHLGDIIEFMDKNQF